MPSTIIVGGSVSPTGHPLVASYTVTAPSGATVDVEFGPDTSYGRRTSFQPAPPGGGPVAILVAGMRATSTYHMRARIVLADGAVVWDADQAFQTGVLPAGIMPSVTTQTFSPAVSPGVELINIITPSFVSVAVDLSGEIIWYYHDPADDAWQGYAFPIRPLPNGHMLASVTNIYNALPNTVLPNPEPTVPPPTSPAPWSVLREVDLAGQTVVNASGPRSLTLAQLNARLKAVPTARGTVVTASFFEHDVLPLPDGHVILLVRHEMTVDIVTVVGNPPVPTLVTGNALVDLDESFQPVWVWSTFDYLDVNRRPMLFPDWTHCNAIVATPDGHLLLSSRHQSWIMKLDYANGAGSGRLLWTLGFGGTFALTGGDPGDWFYGQHAPSIVATDDGGITRLAVVDDGNGRLSLIQSDVAQDKSAPPPGPATPASFSRAVVYDLDETLRTARLSWKYEPGFFTWWGGSILVLPNGNVELDLPQPFAPPNASSRVLEVTSDQPNPKIVWQMDVSPGNAYRSTRIPSLYPGVQWRL